MASFRHDSNASQDIRCRRLLRRLGMEGYGRWWRLCELLAATDGHKIEIGITQVAKDVSHKLMFESTNDLMAFVGELADIGLIDVSGDWCIEQTHDVWR